MWETGTIVKVQTFYLSGYLFPIWHFLNMTSMYQFLHLRHVFYTDILKASMPSSVVASFSYDPANSVLQVVYTSGAVYEYEDVPKHVYDAMKSSFSKGIFLNTEIKSKYKFKKMK